MNNSLNQYQKSAAGFFVAAFGVVILAISAVTTFSFFSTYFAAIFPVDMLGAELASLMAGGAGVVLFDLASVYYLNTFLKAAQTSEQRGITLIMLVVTFVGAAGASIAQLGLAASGDIAMDAATRQSIANASVWTVIIGVVANFGSNLAYGRFSLESKAAVMESDRRDMIQDAENQQAVHLDGLIAQQVKELLTSEAASLAQEQAGRVVDAFRRREMSKYAGTGTPKDETAVSPAPPDTGVTLEDIYAFIKQQIDLGTNDRRYLIVQTARHFGLDKELITPLVDTALKNAPFLAVNGNGGD